MGSRFARAKVWFKKHESRISIGALLLGFVLDNLFLGRVDALADILILTTYIAISGLCIILLALIESKSSNPEANAGKHFWLTLGLQFALGGLFSAYFVFYMRGGSLDMAWPFLLLLLIYFVGNELFKKYYLKLSFQLGIYFFALLAYFVIIVPVFLKSIGSFIFLLSSVIAILTFSGFVYILHIIKKDGIKTNRKLRIAYYSGILVLINLFYFTNIIPPLPLILKDSGVYHNLVHKGDGGYIVEVENKKIFGREVFNRYMFEPVFVYTAVYSPIDLNTTIIHNWQRFDEGQGEWVTESDVSVPIRGGRIDGYRLYSLKYNLSPGFWRVNVFTENHRMLGRVKFEIRYVSYPAPTKIIIK